MCFYIIKSFLEPSPKKIKTIDFDKKLIPKSKENQPKRIQWYMGDDKFN